MAPFADRSDAGRQLAETLSELRGQDVVVLGLPRGGVPVAFQVAAALRAPLDLIMVRKLGVPGHTELAMGAIGEDGTVVLDPDVLSAVAVSDAELHSSQSRERSVLQEQVARFRAGRDRVALEGRIAVIVDDGIATGSTARVACRIARQLGARRVIVAAPVAARAAADNLAEADEVICVSIPPRFLAVGAHYADFTPTRDLDVITLLDEAARRTEAPPR